MCAGSTFLKIVLLKSGNGKSTTVLRIFFFKSLPITEESHFFG